MAPFLDALTRAHAACSRALARIDPNDDPRAEPLTPVAVAVIVLLTAFSAGMYLRWKIQPMQDLGHHLAMTAVVTDYARPGSLYPAIYHPFDPLNTNSLLYTVSGYGGRLVGASWAFRLSMATYLAFVPLANLYALRVFGRSPWGAALSVPLVYNMSYVFGFANFLFAAPLFVLAVPAFYRLLVGPSWRRLAWATLLVTLVFLAHVHVFLWLGVLLVGVTLAVFARSVARGASPREARPHLVVLASLAAVTPGLALFARWYVRVQAPPAADELVTFHAEPVSWASLRAAQKSFAQLFADLPAYLRLFAKGEADHRFFLMAALLAAAAILMTRSTARKHPPVLELCALASIASYFVLPEHAAGQAVIGSRQLGVGAWLAAALFTPPDARRAPLMRRALIGATLLLSTWFLTTWYRELAAFQRDEARGLEEVLAHAPPRARMHYVNIGPESQHFNLRSFWHVEKWYMVDRYGQCNENPAFGVMSAVRYRKDYELHRIPVHTNAWPRVDEIWSSFDLVLVHRWRPSPADLMLAMTRGERLAQAGEWQLWRVRH